MPELLDLASVANKFKFDVKILPEEHPEERAARIKSSSRAKLIEDVKGLIIFALMIFLLLVVSAGCLYIVFYENSAQPERQRWAQTILAAIVTGFVSFWFGKSIPKP